MTTTTRMTHRKWSIKKTIKIAWVTGGLIFTLWVLYSSQSKGVDPGYLQDSKTIKVEQTSDFYLFSPSQDFKEVFIFYPGAMVDPKAYVPLCRKIADNNIKVYLIKIPWRLASR